MNRQSAQRIYDLVFDPNNYEGRKIGELKFSGFIKHRIFVELYLRGLDLELLDDNGKWKLVKPVWDKNAQYRVYRPTAEDITSILYHDENLRHLPRYIVDEIQSTVDLQLRWLDENTRRYASITRPRNAGKVAYTRGLYLVMDHYKLLDPNLDQYYANYFTKYQ